ncbi:MAG: hypothetical protein PHW96_01525 [Candidatus Nanoarchaeia archaeon]|nr:hypothetical protein [Candidatus Nanoarchaeia archaeon]
MNYETIVKTTSNKFGFLCREEPKVSETLKESLEILDWTISPREIVIFGRTVFILSLIGFASASITAYLLEYNALIFIAGCAVVPFLLMSLATDYAKSAAKFEVMRSLEYAPIIITNLVISLKQNKNLEEAMLFSAKHGEGKIAKDMSRALYKVWSGKEANLKNSLPELGVKWGRYLPGFKRSMYLIRSSFSEKSESRRLNTLDKAIDVALESMIEKTRDYCSNLMIPTMILFSFGTILPLIIISVLPLMSFLGIGVLSPLNILLLLLITLLGVYIYSERILKTRPATFAPLNIPLTEEMPKSGNLRIEYGDKKIDAPAFVYSVAVGLAISTPGIIFMLSNFFVINNFLVNLMLSNLNTITIVWGFGIGLSVYFYGTENFKQNTRKKMKNLEDEILDGLYQIGNRIGEYRSPEESLKFVSKVMNDTSAGNLFRDASNLIRKQNMTLKKAFFGENGVLQKVYSPTVKSMISVFVNSVKKGTVSASETLFTLTNHFTELKKTENELKNMLYKNLSMMKLTVLIFAPISCGLIVTLQQLMQSSISTATAKITGLGFSPFGRILEAPVISSEILQLITGIYTLILGVILIRYVTKTQHGDDKVITKIEIAKSIPIMLTVFTLTVILSRIFLVP